jgi:hypothetical protein
LWSCPLVCHKHLNIHHYQHAQTHTNKPQLNILLMVSVTLIQLYPLEYVSLIWNAIMIPSSPLPFNQMHILQISILNSPFPTLNYLIHDINLDSYCHKLWNNLLSLIISTCPLLNVNYYLQWGIFLLQDVICLHLTSSCHNYSSNILFLKDLKKSSFFSWAHWKLFFFPLNFYVFGFLHDRR